MSNGLGWPECVCNVGCQRCGIHPDNLRTKEQKIAFRVTWDAEVEKGSK